MSAFQYKANMRGLATVLRVATGSDVLMLYSVTMSTQAEYYNPVGKRDTLDTWRHRMRMPVPTRACNILDIRIVALYETTNVNGLPLDALIEAQITEDKRPVQFGVVFSLHPPDWDAYGISILWIDEGRIKIGRWKGMV